MKKPPRYYFFCIIFLVGSSLSSCSTGGGNGWSAPVELGATSTGAPKPQVVIDENGNATVAWDQGGGIWASRYDAAAATWSAPQRIDTQNSPADAPRIALLSSGEVLAVWAQSDGIQFSIWAAHYHLGSGWSVAEEIETSDTDSAWAPVISGGGDSAIVIWEQYDGALRNVWANRYVAGSGWGAAELIETDDTGDAGFLSVSVQSNGDGIAVWEHNDGTQFDAWANRYVAGVGWDTAGPIETTPEGALEPVVTMDGLDNGIVLWTYISGSAGVGIGTNRYTAGVGWGTASTLPGSANYYVPALDSDRHGNAMAVWNYDDGSSIHVAAEPYVDGTGWSAAEQLDDAMGNAALYPKVAMNAGGEAVAAWDQGPYILEEDLYVSRYRPGRGWSNVRLGNLASDQQVDINDEGTAIVVWEQFDGIQLHLMASFSSS